MTGIGQLLGRTLVLLAHPDDEAVGCGALLQRMREPAVAFLTDGAPEDRYFWGRFASREHYAEVRQQEARLALAAVGVSTIEFVPLVMDQRLHLHLSEASAFLSRVIENSHPEALLSLAYEGGHPDHDSCSFLAHHLATRFSLPVWEMPLYFRHADGFEVQAEFLGPTGVQITIEPTLEELARKRTMLAAYASQGETLQRFTASVERFRPQATYDYSRPPHEGTLNYEAWGWRISGSEVCASFARFRERTRTEAA